MNAFHVTLGCITLVCVVGWIVVLALPWMRYLSGGK